MNEYECDEWVVGESLDGERRYVVHLTHPRFIVEMENREDEGVEIGAYVRLEVSEQEVPPHWRREAIVVLTEAGTPSNAGV